MKKLEELGISPAPWNFGQTASENYKHIFTSGKHCVSLSAENADARLIAAAPELYDACYRVQQWEDYAKAHNKAIEPWKDIMHDMRAALRKASGESEVRHA